MFKNIRLNNLIVASRNHLRCCVALLLATVGALAMFLIAPQAYAQALGATASFAPTSVVSGANAVLTITINNLVPSTSFANLSSTAPLPLVGFDVVGPTPISNTCPSAVNLTAPTQITLTALTTPVILPSSNCTITVNVVATGLPGSTGTFTLPINSLSAIDTTFGVTVTAPTQTFTIPASIIAPDPQMTVTVTPTTVPVSTPAALTFTLINADTAAAPINGGQIIFPISTTASTPVNSCGTTLNLVLFGATFGYSFGGGAIPASGSCTITFNVQSATPGAYVFAVNPGDLVANDIGNTNRSTTTLTVTAPAPAITLTTSPVVFGPQTINTTSPAQVVTLTNSGSANLTLNVPTSTGPFAFTTNCPFLTPPVPPGGSCTFNITFTPTVVGAAASTIDFASNAPSSPTSIALSGTGAAVAVPGVVITPTPPTPLTFAAQTVSTTSASQNILVTNTGAANLLINAITITTGAADFARVLPSSGPADCLGVLAPSAQCAIAITFTPQAVGASIGSVQIITNATPTTYNVPLAGTGTAAVVGLLAVSDAINFGDQIIGTSSNPQTVFISNVGNGFVFVNSVGVAGPNAADFQSSGICGGLVPGATCAVSVSFNPVTIGPKTAQLAIGSDAQNAATVNAIGLSGNGVPLPRPLAALSATAVGFGNTIFGGAAAPQTVTLTNNGTLPLLIQSTTTSAEYTQANNCPASLSPQASCTISLSFTPFGLGPRSGEFVLNSNSADSPNRVLLGGNGCRWFKPPGSRLFANICRN